MNKTHYLSSIYIYAVSNFFVAVIPFLLMPLLTRYLEPSDYGIIALITMLISLGQIFVGVSSHGYLAARYFDLSSVNLKRFISTSILMLTVNFLSILIIVNIIYEYLSSFIEINRIFMNLSILVAFSQCLIQLQLTHLQYSSEAQKYANLRFFQAILDATLSIIFIIIFKLGLEGRVWALVISAIATAILSLCLMAADDLIGYEVKKEYISEILKFGIPLFPHAIGSFLLSMGDRAIIENRLGIEYVGIYLIAMQIGLVIGLLVDSMNKAISPLIIEKIKNMSQNDKISFVRMFYVYCILLFLIALLADSLINLFLNILIGEKFQSSKDLFIYIFLGQSFTGMYYIVVNFLFYLGKTGKLSIISIIIGMLSVCVSWSFISWLGLIGAAINFMLSQLMLFLTVLVYSNRIYKMPWVTALYKKAD